MRTVTVVLVLLLVVCSSYAEEVPTRLLRHPDYNNGRLVFTYMGDIWVYNGKTPARRLTLHTGADIYPRFSPDGRWIAFSSNRTGNWDVFVIPSRGGRSRQLTFNTGGDVVVTWTPDSKFVVFRSGRDSRRGGRLSGSGLYKVSFSSTKGELPERLPMGAASYGTFSSDGRYFAYNRMSPFYSRKGYRSSCAREIWLYDFQDKSFKRITNNNLNDNSPMISGWDMFFVSERGGTFNIWKMPRKGGEARQITLHTGEGALYPSISSDGKVIVYERGFGIWKLDVETEEYAKFDIKLRTDYRENPVLHKKYSSEVEEYSISPDGKRAAISVHGEIFTVPLDKGKVVQVTDNPARDKQPSYGPKGEKIAFISDRSGCEQAYTIDADGSNLKRVTDSDALKFEVDWSPDGKKLSVTESDRTLRIYDLESGESTVLVKNPAKQLFNIRWSPDGRWIAYLKANPERWEDVYIISTVDEEPVEHCIVRRLPYDEYGIYFTKEKIFFLAETTEEGDVALYCVPLSKEEIDPDDPEVKEKKRELKEEEKKKKDEEEDEKEEKEEKKEDEKKEEKLPEMQVDTEDIQKRMKQVLSVPGKIQALAVSSDSSIAVLVKEPRGKKEINIIYSFSLDKKELKQIGSGSSIKSLRFSPDGKKLFYISGKSLYHMPKSGGSAKKVSFRVEVEIDRFAKHSQIFNECWRVLKHTYYDPNMHGVDWDTVREKYNAILPSVTDKEALGHVINRMLGELNSSHLGMYVESPYSVKATYDSKHPGFELVADKESGRYRVDHIYTDGPADKDWVDVKVGDYVLSIAGVELKVPDNYWKILNHALNERVDVSVSSHPDGKEERTSTVRLIGGWDVWGMRYEEWVQNNRKKVDKLSGGRLAYIHLPSMSPYWVDPFNRELMTYRNKEGLVMDVRYNGGGRISGRIIDILERRPYLKRAYRDAPVITRPINGFLGKKILLQNERSFSDAENFPRIFKDVGLGKVVGVPTPGHVIGTSGYGLIDGSSVRTPVLGCYALDGTNLENWGVKPDIFVENKPADELQDRDAQLERAVAELLKELDKEKK